MAEIKAIYKIMKEIIRKDRTTFSAMEAEAEHKHISMELLFHQKLARSDRMIARSKAGISPINPHFSKDTPMSQVLFTIEIRVDFRDESKVPLFRKLVQQAGRHVYSQAGILGEAIKPEIVLFSHDYMNGHADIAIFDDDIIRGETAIVEAGIELTNPASASEAAPKEIPAAPIAAPLNDCTTTKEGYDSPFSPELLAALK